MGESGRETGWYQDPWGTDGLRWFDGRAWTQTTREDTPLEDTTARPVATAGWYPDPWGVAAWRWWDGATWTGWTG